MVKRIFTKDDLISDAQTVRTAKEFGDGPPIVTNSRMTELPGGFKLLPCGPDVCQMCAVDHPPENPHNRDSLYYQYKFFAENERWPTWTDAVSHCEEKLAEFWLSEIRRRGVPVD